MADHDDAAEIKSSLEQTMRETLLTQQTIVKTLTELQENLATITQELQAYRTLGKFADLLMYINLLNALIGRVKEMDGGEIFLGETTRSVIQYLIRTYPSLYADMFAPKVENRPEGCPGWGTYSTDQVVCALCEYNLECMTVKEYRSEAGFSQKDVQWLANLENLFQQE